MKGKTMPLAVEMFLPTALYEMREAEGQRAIAGYLLPQWLYDL